MTTAQMYEIHVYGYKSGKTETLYLYAMHARDMFKTFYRVCVELFVLGLQRVDQLLRLGGRTREILLHRTYFGLVLLSYSCLALQLRLHALQ